LIALVWKDVITELVNKVSNNATLAGTVVGALIVTVICVLGIMLISRLLKEKEEEDENIK
jgi:CDP-diglyceride synthetase